MHWTLFWGGPEHGTIKPLRDEHIMHGARYLCPVIRRAGLDDVFAPLSYLPTSRVRYTAERIDVGNLPPYLRAEEGDLTQLRFYCVMVYDENHERLLKNLFATIDYIFWMCENPLLAYLGAEHHDCSSSELC